MGKVKKIGDEYYIEFVARGLKYQQKAGTDRKKAEELLKKTEEKIRQGEMGTMVRDVDVDIFIADFLNHAKTVHTERTYERYQSLCEHFQEFLKEAHAGIQKLSGVTPRVIEEYKHYLVHEALPNGRGLKPGVINLSLILLKDVLEYARKLEYLNDNPTLHIKLVPPADRNLPVGGPSPRKRFAQEFLQKQPSLVELYQAMKLSDIGKAMVYLPYLEPSGEDPAFGSAHGL